MSSYVGIPSNNPRKYLGPETSSVTIVSRNRSPLSSDIRQPSTGKYYPIGSLWIVSKNPTTGAYGDLWYLSKIVSNVAYWSSVSSSTGEVQIIHTPDGTDVTPTDSVITFVNGSGMNITGSGSSITFNAAGGGFTWENIADAAIHTLVPSHGYQAGNTGPFTKFILPTTASFGDRYIISGWGTGGWLLFQNAGQSVTVGTNISTPGVGGFVSSSYYTDTVFLMCTEDNVSFKALDWQGSLTVT